MNKDIPVGKKMTDKEKIADALNATEISVELEKADIYKFADVLITAGYGNVAGWKRRAEVAERALKDMCEEYEDNIECDLYKECNSDKPCYLCDCKVRLQKAEREIEEEERK